MQYLETYLDICDNTAITRNIYDMAGTFNYTDTTLYNQHLNFMLANLYNIKLLDHKIVRLNQQEFKNNLLSKFNYRCCITGETCLAELSAAHIIPVKDENNYDLDNGLLIMENIHRTFDKLYWSINPYTGIIETLSNQNIGSIREYNNRKFTCLINNNMKLYLLNHYNRFAEFIKSNKN
jgi:predicted restriction endonuclease